MMISEVIHSDADVAGNMWQKLNQKYYSTSCGNVNYVAKSKYGASANCGNCKFYKASRDASQGLCNWQQSVCNKKVAVVSEGWCEKYTSLKDPASKDAIGTGTEQDPIQAAAVKRR